jgi:spore maturation protein SpmA
VVHKEANSEKKLKVLREQCGFIKNLTKLILPLMSDYFDSVREEACIATEYLICNFIP